jgi:isopenicillin N synthase-like dioxygenase
MPLLLLLPGMTYDSQNNVESDIKSIIPVIDLSSWTTSQSPSSIGLSTDDQEDLRQQVAKAVKQACKDIGFFVIQNHGVNETTLMKAWETVGNFFDLPIAQKLEHQSDNEAVYPYGYERSERLTLGKARDRSNVETNAERNRDETLDHNVALPDAKETFSIGPNNPLSGMPSRRYPNIGMQEALDDIYQEFEKLALLLFQVFAMALDLPEHWFDDKMDHHLCALRSLNYPPLKKESSSHGDQHLVIRAGAHTDYGAFTILKTGGPGLQAKKDNNLGDWIDVPHLADSLIINLGDMMQRWTNGKLNKNVYRLCLLMQTCDSNIWQRHCNSQRPMDFHSASGGCAPRPR